MTQSRPDIPDPIMREVRQRCGFGCVICGRLLYDYDHIVDWAIVQKHEAPNITLLCDQHHRDKTAGLLPVATVIAADQNPYCKRAGATASYCLHYSGNACEIHLGDSCITRTDIVDGTTVNAIYVDGKPLLAFTFEDGQLFLTLNVYDEKGNRILWIEKNVLKHTAGSWDIEWKRRNLVIRAAPRNFTLDMIFDPPGRVLIQSGRFCFRGLEVQVRPTGVCLANTRCGLADVTVSGGFDTLFVVGDPPQNSLTLMCVPAEKRGQIDRDAVERFFTK